MVFSRQEYWSGLPFLSPVDHILSDLSTMTHPSWVTHRAWLSFIELDKAVVQVVRLASFLWLWFQCVCPLIPSRNTYCLTWVSLTLDIGYLFTAASEKRSFCSLPGRGVSPHCRPSWPWTWSSSSWPSCARAVIAPWTLPTKVRLVKAMVFLVVVYGCESWTVKKAERWRIDAFELWCWRRLLRESLGLQGDPTSPS